MTNVNVPSNIDSINTDMQHQIFEDKFQSRNNGGQIVFPKIRTVLVEQGVDKITFEVDFKKLNSQLSLSQLNADKR